MDGQAAGEQRRRAPREDLLTELAEAEVDGLRLSDDHVVNFANLLLIAGHITTTLLLGNTVLALDAHPEHADRTRADRTLVPGAIEESPRLIPPVFHPSPMYFGADVDDVSAFLAEQHDMTPAAADRLRADMRDHAGDDGVRYDSAAWFVTARHQT